MKRTFQKVWNRPLVLEPMFLIETEDGQTFILPMFSYLSTESKVKRVSLVSMATEEDDEEYVEE